jgi:hypothetical protein
VICKNVDFSLDFVQNVTYFQSSGTGSSSFNSCTMNSGTAACMSIGAGTIANVVGCAFSSSAAHVLTGAGTLGYAYISFTGGSSGHNVTTETALAQLT